MSVAEEFDLATDARRPRKPGVSGEKRVAEGLGERDVRGVVGSDIGAQFVGTDHQRARREAIQRKGQEVVDCCSESSCGEVACSPPLAEHSDGLDIDEIGCSEMGLPNYACPGCPPVLAVVSDEVGHDRGIDDDQLRPRSSSRSCTAVSNPTLPPRRRPIRSRTSWSVGVLASLVSSLARYCCNDLPSASARLWRLAWTSSGRSLTNTFGMLAFCYQIRRKATVATRSSCPVCAPPGKRSGRVLEGWRVRADWVRGRGAAGVDVAGGRASG